MGKLDGKVAIVTGAGSGIGRAIAARYAEEGAKVDFKPNEERRAFLKMAAVPIDDGPARTEWGWKPSYDYDAIIDDFLAQPKEAT